MKMNDSNPRTPSYEDIINDEYDPTKIYTVISTKIPHKICAVNTNEPTVGLLCSPHNFQSTESEISAFA